MSSLLGIAAGGSSGFYGFDVTNSLRFDDGSSSYLQRTPNGNTQTYSIAFWYKRGLITGTTQRIYHSHDGSATYKGSVHIDTDQKLYFEVGGSSQFRLITNQVFRDVSAWYHIVCVADLTNSTQSDRLKIYINGTRITSFATETQPSNNTYSAGLLNSNNLHEISGADGSSDFLDGYLADFNFLDAVAVSDATSFGVLKSGVWTPKNTVGLTFGVSGFRLQFKQTGTGTASATTIGADTSGRANHFTSNALEAHDVVPDSPTNNFATINSTALLTFVPSEGNLIVTTGNSISVGSSTMACNAGGGKFYFEARGTTVGNGTGVGIVKSSVGGTFVSNTGSIYYTAASGAIYSTIAGATQATGATYTSGDVIGVAVDGENGTVEFFKNGVSQGSASESTIATEDFLAYAVNASTSGSTTMRYNFGQDSTFAGVETAASNADENGFGEFHHSVPSGFLAMCTANFIEPTITPLNDDLPEDYFNTRLYQGNGTAIGSGGLAVTGVGFQPDWVWIKNRDATDDHAVYDVVRGVTKQIETNPDAPEVETTESEGLTAFGADGFTVGSLAQVNTSTEDFVSWNWLAGGSASSNSAGDITSSVSANTKPGFSIVGYTGDGTSATRTIGCGLTKKPEMVILKNRTEDSVNDSWFVWHTAFGTASPSKYMTLYNTDGVDASGVFVDSSFSDNSGNALFAVDGSYNGVNKSGTTYIAYCFNSIEGYSEMGSYTGNGSNDGTFVFLGFRPSWIMTKRFQDTSGSAETSDWIIQDNKRQTFNPSDAWLRPNSNGVEGTTGPDLDLDFVSNGFKVRNNGTNSNISGSIYLYMAFAEMPFKYSNAR